MALLTCMVTVFAAPIRAQRYVSSTPFASLRRAESTRTRGDSARRSDSARVRGDSLRPRGGFRRARPDTSLVAGTEQVLLQLVLEQLEPVALMGLEREGQEVLLPLRAVLEIAEIPNAWRAGRVQGAFDGRDATFSIDVRAGYGAHRNTRFRLPADGVLVAAGEVYVSGRVLEQLLGVNVSVDLGSALVAIRGASEVPAVRRRVRLASRAARAALRDAEHSGSSVERAPSLSPAPARPGFLVDYSAITARGVSATGTATWGASYSLGVGGAVAGGSLFAAGEGAVGSLALHELSWSRGWVDGRGVSALRIGDIWSAGPRPTPLRGITISNAALRPPRVAAILPLGGALPGGWDLEAYHDGQVSDVVSSEDGRYRIDVPVGMGSTTVEFIAYGPNGAQRTFRRTLHTAPQFVAPGRAEYAVSLGACPELRGQSALGIQGTERSCNGRANADVRYGLRQGVVLRGGMDAVMGIAGARPVRWTPYAGLGAVLGRSAVVEATLAPKDERDGGRLAELSVRYEP
ncbi:MAG: hypothetical protein ABIZ91_15790 [Gemmatimonadaceae bacterium]